MRRQIRLSQDPVDARQFEVTVKQLANSLNFGREESVFHGAGLEYAQSRLYVQDNPVRSIDWKAISSRLSRIAWVWLTLLFAAASSSAEEGAWKTAYVKRGFVGAADAGWTGGPGATQRMRTPLQFGGTKVRVHVCGLHEQEVELAKMAFVKGADEQGKITGELFPVLFKGAPNLTLEKGLKRAVSDEVSIPVTRGTWYVQDQYASQKFPYAYEVDRGFCEAGDAFGKETLKKPLASRTGILCRVDVFTTDSRSSMVCYGDSITHGYNSTPNADQRYPAILGKLLDRPVLNLGQNGDLALYSGGIPGAVKGLAGVDTVIYLMGINDIVSGGKVNSAKAYAEAVRPVIAGIRQLGMKIYIGTIPPAGGLKQFDADPAKESLRKEINAWIAQGNGADGVIDFAAALADPADPTKLKADCQSDWIHPNDLGYQKMAEAAAKTLAGK